MLAHPSSCVYVRNSDTAGACLLCTLPNFQMAKAGSNLQGCASRLEVGSASALCKGGTAKENCLVLPGSESDCSYQLREMDFSGISPAPGVSWFALEDSFLWKLAFPDS